MEQEIENLDSPNEETPDEPDALKEKNKELSDKNRQLFERAKKAETELKTLKDSPRPKSQPEEMDYAKLAYLANKGIDTDDSDELALVEEVIGESGKTLKEAIATNYFKTRLKEVREIKAAKAALPSSSGRAYSGGRDQVEYWLAKGELPAYDQPELRREVVKARLAKEENANKFSPTPIIH